MTHRDRSAYKTLSSVKAVCKSVTITVMTGHVRRNTHQVTIRSRLGCNPAQALLFLDTVLTNYTASRWRCLLPLLPTPHCDCGAAITFSGWRLYALQNNVAHEFHTAPSGLSLGDIANRTTRLTEGAGLELGHQLLCLRCARSALVSLPDHGYLQPQNHCLGSPRHGIGRVG